MAGVYRSLEDGPRKDLIEISSFSHGCSALAISVGSRFRSCEGAGGAGRISTVYGAAFTTSSSSRVAQEHRGL